MTQVKYEIGASYKYFNNSNIFVLKSADSEKGIFTFDCGHAVTDNVFMDMIHVNSGQFVYDISRQITLF